MNWTELDWKSLMAHREQFLGARAGQGPYWGSASDLANYDATFGERIGWKWDAVIEELRMRGWTPPAGTVLDWGCGSGIASRRVIGAFGAGSFKSLLLWDHSALAEDFACGRARDLFPGLEVASAGPDFIRGRDPIGLLVVSHVLNELEASALEEIAALVARSSAVLWAEPGSRDTSRSLGLVRERWIHEFRVVAPCTHSNACPILGPGNERHWCHHFAPPPPAIFADSNWVKFGQRAGIDLRSLPYSFLALDRAWTPPDGGLSRVIGRPEHFKPYVRLLNCDAGGLAELSAAKRDCAGLCKELGKTKKPLVYAWERDGANIRSGSAPRPRS
ncbi:MAG: small ribosomal subunit Rsm22 family protein [Opitutaceae bacterium]